MIDSVLPDGLARARPGSVHGRERTFVDYLIKPVTDSMARAFHEQ